MTTSPQPIDHPNAPQPIADWWYCGDEICRCSQPRIVWRAERGLLRVENGPFHSEPETTELREQWTWMLAAARRHSVENLAEIEEDAKAAFEWMDNP